jgi:hypothetical protein
LQVNVITNKSFKFCWYLFALDLAFVANTSFLFEKGIGITCLVLAAQQIGEQQG